MGIAKADDIYALGVLALEVAGHLPGSEPFAQEHTTVVFRRTYTVVNK